MKKVMMTLALLLTAVAMSAQLTGVKITPKFQKGDSKLYRTMTTMNVGGQVINMVGEMRYTVTGATPAGYTLEVCLEKMDTDDQENLVGRIMTLNQGIMKGLKTVYTTDAEGVITDIKNFDEVKSAGKDAIEKMFDELTAELPEVAQILPKEAFVNQVDASLTKENVIASVKTNGSPFALYGKTISTGLMDEGTDNQGRKTKNMYFLSTPDGSKVKVTSALNMSKEEMKKMIIDQVKKMMPAQAEMIEQNFDQIMASGMLKMEMNTTSDYEIQPDGWVKSISTEIKQNSMGQAVEGSVKTELVPSSK